MNIKLMMLMGLLISPHVIAGTFLLNDYNLITLGDFSSNSDIEGRTFIGGDLIGSSSHNYGIHLSAPFNEPTLQVAGMVQSGNPLSVQGSMEVGLNNTVKVTGQKKVNNRHVNNATDISKVNLDSLVVDYSNQLQTDSLAFSQMTSNSTVNIPYGQPGPYKFNVDQSLGVNDYAVFDIGQWAVFQNTKVQQIEMLANNINSLAGIILNVGGLNANWTNSGNMVGSVFTSEVGRGKILWNFFEATTIDLYAHSFMGSILAPYATVTSANPIEGSVGVFSLLTTSEIHLPNSVVEAPTAVSVSEPKSMALMLPVFLLLLYFRSKLAVLSIKCDQ
jgi:choice-of-anchor A domain-containing protein